MKIAAFVPIKLKNERLENKNILPLKGKPLCYYIFLRLLESNLKTYVYCSDEKIKEFIPQDVIFVKRNKILDQNTTKGLEIYNSFVNEINADAYVLAHATSPFTKTTTIKKCIDSFENYDSSLTVLKYQTFSWFKNKPINYNLSDIPRTQDIEPIYIETSSVYSFKKEIILNNRRIGYNPNFIEVDLIEAIDIDNESDYNFAKKLENLIG
jgi:CMP-N-acetylneuraminic acid synthetase